MALYIRARHAHMRTCPLQLAVLGCPHWPVWLDTQTTHTSRGVPVLQFSSKQPCIFANLWLPKWSLHFSQLRSADNWVVLTNSSARLSATQCMFWVYPFRAEKAVINSITSIKCIHLFSSLYYFQSFFNKNMFYIYTRFDKENTGICAIISDWLLPQTSQNGISNMEVIVTIQHFRKYSSKLALCFWRS